MERQATLSRLLAVDAIQGARVENPSGEELGSIQDLVVDVLAGRISYAVLSFGGFLGLNSRLFAIPWGALSPRAEGQGFVLNVDRELLENAPGFDKDRWPDMADLRWGAGIHSYYGLRPYWECPADKE